VVRARQNGAHRILPFTRDGTPLELRRARTLNLVWKRRASRALQSPSLADKVALRTSDYSIEEIGEEIAAVVTSTHD
jgi:hypothetical protein